MIRVTFVYNGTHYENSLSLVLNQNKINNPTGLKQSTEPVVVGEFHILGFPKRQIPLANI